GAATYLQAFDMARAGGTVTFIGIPPMTEQVTFPAIAFLSKVVMGCNMGGDSGARLAALATDLYLSGQLKLDEMVTRTYALGEVNEAFTALERGENVRGVVRPSG